MDEIFTQIQNALDNMQEARKEISRLCGKVNGSFNETVERQNLLIDIDGTLIVCQDELNAAMDQAIESDRALEKLGVYL